MRSAAVSLQSFDLDAVLAGDGLERVQPSAYSLFQRRELFLGRPRVSAGCREDVEDVFVHHAHVAAQLSEPSMHLRRQRIEASIDAGEPLVDAREPLVDPVESLIDLRELLVDPVEPLVDLCEPLVDVVEALVNSRQRLIDSIEPLFGHASLRSRDDDDTSSRGGLEEQSACLAKWRANSPPATERCRNFNPGCDPTSQELQWARAADHAVATAVIGTIVKVEELSA